MEKENISNTSLKEENKDEEELDNPSVLNQESVEVENASEETAELEDDYGEDDEDDEYEEVEDDDKIAIDLSDNPVYRGLCTLLEDDEGNNLLEYISLLHSELIGHNKTMKGIKKDLGRLANCAEQYLKTLDK